MLLLSYILTEDKLRDSDNNEKLKLRRVGVNSVELRVTVEGQRRQH